MTPELYSGDALLASFFAGFALGAWLFMLIYSYTK